MTARIVKIGKASWLAGMSWCSFEDVPSKAEMVEDAQRLNASWSALRKGESAIQGGFCAPVEGMKTPGKVFSLAAMLADSRKQPWLGIFKISDGLWWYVAVRDEHAILPDGDVIGGEEEIYAARERHSGYGDWNFIEGDRELLEELISEVEAKPTRVRSLTGPTIPLVPVLAATFGAAVLLGGGGYWWMEHKAAQERERAAAMERMRAEIAAEAGKAVVVTKASSLPAPNAWLKACQDVLYPVPLSEKGWALDQVSCQGDSAMLRWRFQPGATVADRPEGEVSAQGDAIEQAIPLKGLQQESADDAVELDEAKLTLRAWAQAGGFAVAFDETPPPPPLPGAEPAPAAAKSKEVRVLVGMPVSVFGVDLSRLPGLRLMRITPASNGSGWEIEGIIYGR